MNRRSNRASGGLVAPLTVISAMGNVYASPPLRQADVVHAVTSRSFAEDKNRQEQGRAIVELIRSGNTDAVFARFTPQMAQAVPLATLNQVVSSLRTEAVIAERLEEIVTEVNNTSIYVAEHKWKPEQTLRLTITFAPDGHVSGLLVKPVKPLPLDPYADYQTKTPLQLPFAPGEDWLVFWGGNNEVQNYHVIAPDQRHAFDIVARAAGTLSTHKNEGTQNEDYAVWGRAVAAPAAATVIEVMNDVPDNVPGKMNPKQAAGNHIVLDFGNGEYAVLAHFQQNSITVKMGDRVTAGQILGKCGNSGNSSEPHLHFHLQDKPALFGPAHGLPVVFMNYVSNNNPVASGSPAKGELLRIK